MLEDDSFIPAFAYLDLEVGSKDYLIAECPEGYGPVGIYKREQIIPVKEYPFQNGYDQDYRCMSDDKTVPIKSGDIYTREVLLKQGYALKYFDAGVIDAAGYVGIENNFDTKGSIKQNLMVAYLEDLNPR